jgi:hypothetical protein
MMPGLAPIGARVAPIPQRRIFRAATAGAGRAHNPLAVSGVIWPREACGSGDAATIGSLVLPVAAERGKEGGEGKPQPQWHHPPAPRQCPQRQRARR